MKPRALFISFLCLLPVFILPKAVFPGDSEKDAPPPSLAGAEKGNITLEELIRKTEAAYAETLNGLEPQELGITVEARGPGEKHPPGSSTIIYDRGRCVAERFSPPEEEQEKKNGDQVTGLNDRYLFVIDGNRLAGEWNLVRAGFLDKKTDPAEWLADRDRVQNSSYGRFPHLFLPFRLVGDCCLLDVLRTPELEIESLEAEEDNGVRLSYKIRSGAEPVRRLYPIEGGTIRLTADFLVKESSVRLALPDYEPLTIVNEYAEPREAGLFPLVRHTETSGGGDTASTHVTEVSASRLKPVPRKRFTLSYYGLPEIERASRPAGGIRIVIAGLGFLLTVTALCLIYRKRRHAAERENK